jgi:hypothetical protein
MNFEEVTNQIVKDQTFKAASQKAPTGKQLTTDFSTTKK